MPGMLWDVGNVAVKEMVPAGKRDTSKEPYLFSGIRASSAYQRKVSHTWGDGGTSWGQ